MCWFPPLQRFQVLRPMISSGERSMPPSIGLKMSATICGKSAVLLPAAFASSTGSFFVQLTRATHAKSQLPTRARRRKSSLPFPSAFTAPPLICWPGVFWQENSKGNLGSQNGREFVIVLEKIEQTLADCEETEGSPGKKNRANKRLFGQRRERARLEIADFSHELIERLPFRFAFLTQEAKPAQVIERSFTQLFGRVPEQDCAAERPSGGDCKH